MTNPSNAEQHPHPGDKLAASLDPRPADEDMRDYLANWARQALALTTCFHTRGGVTFAAQAFDKFLKQVFGPVCQAEALARLNVMRDVVEAAGFPPGVPQHEIPTSLRNVQTGGHAEQAGMTCWDIGEGWVFQAPMASVTCVIWHKPGFGSYLLTAGGEKGHIVETPDTPLGVASEGDGWPEITASTDIASEPVQYYDHRFIAKASNADCQAPCALCGGILVPTPVGPAQENLLVCINGPGPKGLICMDCTRKHYPELAVALGTRRSGPDVEGNPAGQ